MGPRPPKVDPRAWEPEPLELPVEPPARRNRGPQIDDDADGDRDLVGSHVIVIDVS